MYDTRFNKGGGKIRESFIEDIIDPSIINKLK